ncbi:MAG: hypothetical protein JO049_05135 [Hyphomicrobiales bacterium]|nr:hypothetical protein [Hyphomicrobiales bacterium]
MRRPQAVFATGRKRSIDLRLDENVIRPTDHDEMFHVVASDEDELPLAVQTERVDEAQPRLPGPPSWDPQPVREHQTINDCYRYQNSDTASHQNTDLGNRIGAERKVIQPLHAISNARAADRADHNFALRRGDGLSTSSTPERDQIWTRRIPKAPPDRRYAHSGSEQAEPAS